MDMENKKYIYEYCVSVCDIDRKDSFFIPLAYFSENEKDKVDALVELLKTHSRLKPEAVKVSTSTCCLISVKAKHGSAFYKNLEKYSEERNKAFDAKKLLNAKPKEKNANHADSEKAERLKEKDSD